ncbi:DNA polymerase/3'-5' exonuclease PolX [Dactylosporangium sucinum]|uniref:DNA polymerase beta n=1 Tax=Dactylosporangium sucinum TaxID=1424081 RepID=A0A917U9X2_9ACTN|nr:DNA polymerase/3'-5' exonuclease PolX [Dactylosporangium sucinum]GGM68316.1 DNA polymerase/3'-5' exonuclease PolX [Dactylosporangium sucinum]
MARANDAVAALLQEYADLLTITGGEQFKSRVYEKAARAVGGLASDVASMDAGELRQIRGVGASIADKITEYLRDGHVAAVDALRLQVPSGVPELVRIPTLGPRRAVQLHDDLGVTSVDELRDAIVAGKLSGHRGFGERTAENILHGIELLERSHGRVLLSVATDAAEQVVEALRGVRGCRRCMWAGSLRRFRETVGDIDVLAAATRSGPLMDAFVRLPMVAEVLAGGPTKTSVRLVGDLQVDLRVVPLASWGAALQYFTGSKPHNVRIRAIAVRAGFKLSEYGLFRVDDGSLVASATEEEVYERLGLQWVPPPLREDRGEVEAARDHALPALVTAADIRGDLHTHTDLTDGVASLADMVAAARDRGYEYYAVTDHARNMPMQRMTDEKMLAQRRALRELESAGGPVLLHGTELNIGPDGELDWPDRFLAGFDLCVASVHSHFAQPAEQLTRRLIRACENPFVTILGHPTTRLIGKRAPVDADFDAVFAAAARTGTILEVNSFPDRLDLPDELILRAKRHGARFAINTDAHAPVHLDHLRYGIGTAQRAWLTAEDVVNTWPIARLRTLITAKRNPAPR